MSRPAITISEYDYPLSDERIARFPLEGRDQSRLLCYHSGDLSDHRFGELTTQLPAQSTLVFNNTKVIRARLIFHKSSGARIEIFCLEPYAPADYERAFAVRGSCRWSCMVGNSKKWKAETLHIDVLIEGEQHRLSARRVENESGAQLVEFTWSSDRTFGQLLEVLGRIPIPPYLCRESEELDNTRYQTVYSKLEGSVAAPTAGLHFTPELIENLHREGHTTEEVTLHVGAGTFLPVKVEQVSEHKMHTEHFEIRRTTLEHLLGRVGHIVAVGTTSVRTLESLSALAYRVIQSGELDADRAVGQWEAYDIPTELGAAELLTPLLDYMRERGMESVKASTQIMIMPSYRFRVVSQIITNFHQPKSTLLLLVSAFVGEDWKRIYDYALKGDFRFLSYGDSSLLIP